jgi:hypothetical protein
VVGPNGTVKSTTILDVRPVLTQASANAVRKCEKMRRTKPRNRRPQLFIPNSRPLAVDAVPRMQIDLVCSFSTPWRSVKRERRLLKFAVMTRASRRLRPVVDAEPRTGNCYARFSFVQESRPVQKSSAAWEKMRSPAHIDG